MHPWREDLGEDRVSSSKLHHCRHSRALSLHVTTCWLFLLITTLLGRNTHLVAYKANSATLCNAEQTQAFHQFVPCRCSR